MGKYNKVKEQIKQEYETTSKSLRLLSKEYNIPYDTVWTWSKKFNWESNVVKEKDDKRTTSKEIISITKNLYENTSMNIKEISEQLNIPKGTVQSWKQKYNWIKEEQYLEEYKHNKNSKFEKSNINDKDIQQIKYLYENTGLATDNLHWVTNHRIQMMVKYTF